jgi:hypothetical protein
MTDGYKPFICYKSGRGFKITPRNAAGWRAFALWMLAIAPITGLFIRAMQGQVKAGQIAAYVTLYTLAMGAWAVAMIRWMYVRSETVDLNELPKLKNEQDHCKAAEVDVDPDELSFPSSPGRGNGGRC